MAISKEEVEHVARLARIELSDREKEHFSEQLSRILDYISQLEKVNTDNVKPLAQPILLKNVFREDKVVESGKEKDLLSIAPEREENFYKVKKVIE